MTAAQGCARATSNIAVILTDRRVRTDFHSILPRFGQGKIETLREVKNFTTRANTSGNALQEAGTRPFRPTANIDRMIDTLTGSLRENLASLLGAKSETYVRERMAGVAMGY